MKKTKSYRHLVIGLDTKIPLQDGSYRQAINFDNAATTPPIKPVINAINQFCPWYSSIHRGVGYKSKLSSAVYDDARKVVAEFVGADFKKDTIIFVKNTTEALNKLSYRLQTMFKDSIILSTSMEHHSNDLPWRSKYKVDYIQVDQEGRLMLDDLENKLIHYNGKVKLVTVTGASNVTGYINPIHTIAKIAHQHGAKIAVDGAQLIPHMTIEMHPKNPLEHIDFLAFSAHKMYAPFGTGVLIGPKEYFSQGAPEYSGGGTVKVVTPDRVIWDSPPNKEEAGTPNIMGVVALQAAIKAFQIIGLEHILAQEKTLTNYALLRLKEIPDIIVYGNQNCSHHRVGIIPINMKDVPHQVVAHALSLEFGIAVRNGCFCAQPYVQKLLNIQPNELMQHLTNPNGSHPGLIRISFGFYNVVNEIDVLIEALKKIATNKTHYIQHYNI